MTGHIDARSIFIRRLNELDRGDRARLRRNAGNTISESRDVLGIFYQALPPNVPGWQQERYFLLATLFPSADANHDRNLGASLRRIRDTRNPAALDRRVAALLDADMGQLPFRLRQMIRLIDSQHGGVNWEQLLTDLLQWEWADRRVQRAWAMDYYAERTASHAADGGEKEA